MYLFIYFLIICRYNVKTGIVIDNTQDNLINISTSPSIFASTSYSAKINNFDELYEQAQNIITVNGNYAKLYQKIIDAFFKKYIHTIDKCCDTKTYLMFIIPADYKPDDIKLLCDQVKKEFFATVTMNDNNEMEFYDCFINLFIETATFALNTIEKVIKLYNHHKHNNDETRKALEANSQLFYDYVISINWADYFYNADIKLCHLYNVYFFEGYKQSNGNHIFAYSYYYNEVFSEHPEYFDNMIECLQKYYKENDFTSQQKMYENEKPDKIREWVSKQEDIQSKEMIYKYLDEVMKIIWLERSRRTKITYLARSLYYKNRKQEKIYELKLKQQEFMTKLKLDSIVENIYDLKFNALRMCSVDSISNTFSLITNINKNIQRLLEMTIETKQYLFEHIKKKTKLVVNEHYDEQERNENNTEKQLSEQKNDILNRITAKINELQMINIRVKDHYKTLPLVHGQEKIITNDELDAGFADFVCCIAEDTNDVLTSELQDVCENIKTSKAYRSCITFSEKTAYIVELAGCLNEKFDSKNFEHIKNCLNYIVKIPNHIRAKENTLLRLSYKKTTEATAIMVMHEEDEIFGLLDTLLQLKDMIMEAETEMFEVVRDLRKENDK